MKQAIAGLTLSSEHESTALIVWPSVSATSIGQFLGRLYEMKGGVSFLSVGNLFVLLSIPIAIPLYLWNVLPVVGTRYRVTNRHVNVERGVQGVMESQIALDAFDQIEIRQQPGQTWFRSADLVFYHREQEVFSLPGVPYPEGFRTACQRASMTYRGFKEIHQRQASDA
ncbi:PH domain-containing protein [Bremerella sp. JC770]|uniref:PH domain-containing protein n=1 Tax=Bremerella sp. JC770 TaxID=3232137 RepID=UPI00345B12AA